MGTAVVSIDSDLQVAKVVRVDKDNELALLLVGGREGQPGRTRWSFLKDLPPGLLGVGASESHNLPKEGKDESTWTSEKPQNVEYEEQQQQQQQQEMLRNGVQGGQVGAERGRGAVPGQPVKGGGTSSALPRSSDGGGVTTNRTDQEQAGRSIAVEDQQRTTRREKRRPYKEGSRDLAEQQPQQQQQSLPAERELAEDISGDSPTLPACTGTSMADPEGRATSASVSAESGALPAPPELFMPIARRPETLSADTDGTDADRDAGLGEVSPVVYPPKRMRDLLEVKASNPGGKRDDSARSGEGPVSATANATTTKGSAGLGVFCKRAIRAGDVIFEEEALLKVSKDAVDCKVWDVVSAVACKYQRASVFAMDLLQVVAFARAPPSVQARVLKLFAPEEAAFPLVRRQAWNDALDMLHRHGLLAASPAAGGRESAGGDAGRSQESGAQSGGGRGPSRPPLGAERRSMLTKVLMICESNIFGEPEDEEDGTRVLFELTTRMNHSCLPNCGYDLRNGRVVVRASVDVPQGTELFISYLSCQEIMKPTKDRRFLLAVIKFFECHCSRCDAAHDVWRGFRCPRCHEGVVYPPNAGRISPRPPADVGYGPAPGVSACTACGRVPTASWLRSANKLEVKVSDVVEEVTRNDYMAHLAHKDMPRAWKMVRQAYAAGVYLFAAGHFLMSELHEIMASCFLDQTDKDGAPRAGEAAYHLHQMLANHISMLRRPTGWLAEAFCQLARNLSQAGGWDTQQQDDRHRTSAEWARQCTLKGTSEPLMSALPHVRYLLRDRGTYHECDEIGHTPMFHNM